MLKFRDRFLVIINLQAHVHGEKTGQIVVSGHDHAKHFLEVLRHGDFHQLACRDKCSIDGGDAGHLCAAVEERILPLP